MLVLTNHTINKSNKGTHNNNVQKQSINFFSLSDGKSGFYFYDFPGRTTKNYLDQCAKSFLIFPLFFTYNLLLFKKKNMASDEEANLLTEQQRSLSKSEKLWTVFIWIWRFLIFGITGSSSVVVTKSIMHHVLGLSTPGNKNKFV